MHECLEHQNTCLRNNKSNIQKFITAEHNHWDYNSIFAKIVDGGFYSLTKFQFYMFAAENGKLERIPCGNNFSSVRRNSRQFFCSHQDAVAVKVTFRNYSATTTRG